MIDEQPHGGSLLSFQLIGQCLRDLAQTASRKAHHQPQDFTPYWRVRRCRQGYPALGVRRKGHRTTLIDLPTRGRAQLHERLLRRACVVVASRLDGYPLARQDRLPIGVRKKGPGQSWDHPKETTWKAGCDAARSAREPS